ncbi:hypothetical protein L6452_43125 [Arctium lappa]|uniref:Uncharacterized protein n=1 Tax=Arctium lappa TaxID=4217 RepID=A0ACB8XK36_ARCLA|nr:hypothetical protein L6452_43125 [Arctium lappa]
MREFAPLDDSQGNNFSYYSNQAMNKSFVKGNEQELRSCSPSVVGLCCRMGVQENGSGHLGMSGVSLGSKNKYRRMDSELTDHNTK